MELVFFDDMSEPTALFGEPGGPFLDVTSMTDQVVHVPLNEEVQVRVVWAYCYYRIPMTSISKMPIFISRDLDAEPVPTLTNAVPITDAKTGKMIGVAFDMCAKHLGSWQCSVQIECKAATYTQKRDAYFTVTSQQSIDHVVEAMQ